MRGELESPTLRFAHSLSTSRHVEKRREEGGGRAAHTQASSSTHENIFRPMDFTTFMHGFAASVRRRGFFVYREDGTHTPLPDLELSHSIPPPSSTHPSPVHLLRHYLRHFVSVAVVSPHADESLSAPLPPSSSCIHFVTPHFPTRPDKIRVLCVILCCSLTSSREAEVDEGAVVVGAVVGGAVPPEQEREDQEEQELGAVERRLVRGPAVTANTTRRGRGRGGGGGAAAATRTSNNNSNNSDGRLENR